MNERRSFIRKVIYGCCIAVLLLPLSLLSQPATTEAPGGVLAQQRAEHRLSQAALGEIDPASVTIKLATLGMSNIAANILWSKANHYKKVEDWTSLDSTLQQISKLQPNFVYIWRFQAWNLSYNVSVEFDDYHDRYYWVIKGINFLKEGTHYNRDEPRLLWDIGWFIAQKIGRADEHVEYRQLFREDDDFHRDSPNRRKDERDNWLVGREWFLKAENAYDNGNSIKGMSPLVFLSDSPMCLINYGEALEDEGVFGERAKYAWMDAGKKWHDFGNRDVQTTLDMSIRLNEQEKDQKLAAEAREKLDALSQGAREEVRREKIAKLSKQQREALETPANKRDSEQQRMMTEVEDRLKVADAEVADRAPAAVRPEALRLAEAAAQLSNTADIIDRYRQIVNFAYWRLRCEMERSDDAVLARKTMYDARKAFELARLTPALELFDEGLGHWRKVLDKHPSLLAETTITEDLAEAINGKGGYRELLHQLGKDFPEKFVLKDVLEAENTRNPSASQRPTDFTQPETGGRAGGK